MLLSSSFRVILLSEIILPVLETFSAVISPFTEIIPSLRSSFSRLKFSPRISFPKSKFNSPSPSKFFIAEIVPLFFVLEAFILPLATSFPLLSISLSVILSP